MALRHGVGAPAATYQIPLPATLVLGRMQSTAHRKQAAEIKDVALPEVAVDDTLVIDPHGICPVDGVVTEGHGMMDESYLTG